MRRKLCCYTLFAMMGIIAGYLLGWKVGSALFFICISLWKWVLKKQKGTTLYVIAFLLGFIWFLCFQYHFTHGYYHEIAEQKGSCLVTAIITNIERKDQEQYQMTLESQGERILVSYYGELKESEALIGKTISFSTQIGLPDLAGNPRTFDYRLYLLTKGIEYTCTMDSFTVENPSSSIRYKVKGTILTKRNDFLKRLAVSDEVAGILGGILFGDKSQIDEDLYEGFRKNGTAHVLAVSGLHVGILYSAYKKLYERKKSIFFTIAFILFLLIYGSAALWAVSVTRAIGLVLLVTLGKSFHRRYDLLTAVSAMAMVSMIQNPYVIFGAAFQMSFLAVVSITFLQRFFEGLVGEKWAVPFAVQAGLMPYMAYTFNYVSFVGILCNVPVIFLATLLVPLGMIGFVFFLFTGILLPDLSMALEWISRLMIWTNHVFLADGVLSFDVISPPMWMMLLLYGIMFFCTSEYFHIYFYRKEWRKLLVPILLILVIVLGGLLTARSAFDRAELVFVDVGQGDCLHVKTPKGIQVLIDGGGRFGYDMGEKTLKPYLLKNRVDYLDLVATTHLHLDHYGGIEQLLSCYPVNQLITAGKKGDCIVLEDGYFVEILWPMTQNPKTEDENENSLIFMIHHNGLKTLITGDITAEGEDMLLKAYRGTDKLKADILKVAHHGSSYSSSDAFLDAVNPQVAVISVGQNNYGHPSEIVIENLEKKGIMVFRTDMDGAVGIINRKGTISVCTKKQR